MARASLTPVKLDDEPITLFDAPADSEIRTSPITAAVDHADAIRTFRQDD